MIWAWTRWLLATPTIRQLGEVLQRFDSSRNRVDHSDELWEVRSLRLPCHFQGKLGFKPCYSSSAPIHAWPHLRMTDYRGKHGRCWPSIHRTLGWGTLRLICRTIHLHCHIFAFRESGIYGAKYHCCNSNIMRHCTMVVVIGRRLTLGFKLLAKATFFGLRNHCHICSNEHQRNQCVIRC